MKKQTPNARRDQLFRCIPEAFIYKTMLYVGANVNRMQMIDLFRAAKYRIDVLEIWLPNIKRLRLWNRRKRYFGNIYWGDIRNYKSAKKYDVVMWWHGPEHIAIDDLGSTLNNLESLAIHYVILASPWGRVSQRAVGGNKFERHVAPIYRADYYKAEYQIDALGEIDRPGSNLLAWKKIA